MNSSLIKDLPGLRRKFELFTAEQRSLNKKRFDLLELLLATAARNSSLFIILRDVKEPTHCSKRVGHGVPCVVVWPCCAHAVLTSFIVSRLLGLLL